MVLGAGGTSRDLLIGFTRERARKGAKMEFDKEPTGSMFGAFHFSDTNSYRNEHDRKGQGHNKSL